MTVPALDPDRLFELLTRFHPQDSALVLSLIQHSIESAPTLQASQRHLLEAFKSLSSCTAPDLYLAVSRQEAREYWDTHLVGLPPTELGPHVNALKGRILWGLIEVLCNESRAVASQEPRLAESLAAVAVAAAPRAPLVQYLTTSSTRQELIAATHAFLANAYRAADRLAEARRLFARVERTWPASDTLGLQSAIYSLRASLEIDECRFDDALRTIAAALAATSERAEKVKLYLKRTMVWTYSREYLRALEAVEQALPLLDESIGGRLCSCALQHQVELLSRLARFEEAQERLPDLRRQVETLGSELDLLRFHWVEARTSVGLGRTMEGEAGYRQVRAGFLRHALPYNAAVVTVELARHLFRQGRFPEVATLAVESAVEFRRQGVKEEVVAALGLLEEATCGHLTTAAIDQLLKRIEAASIGT